MLDFFFEGVEPPSRVIQPKLSWNYSAMLTPKLAKTFIRQLDDSKVFSDDTSTSKTFISPIKIVQILEKLHVQKNEINVYFKQNSIN